MAENSSIQWTNNTMNPWRGCTKISAGCAHCYADRQAHRNPNVLGIWGPNGTRVLASDAHWNLPLRWEEQAEVTGRKTLIFCASLADIFEDWPGQMTDSRGRPIWLRDKDYDTDEGAAIRPFTLNHARARLWDLIRRTPNLIWQLLTKRPDNIDKMMPPGNWPNVWLGASVENQENTWRIDALQEAPQVVPVRFLSIEPLLGPVDISTSVDGIQWVIIGGESGGSARPLHVEWVRDVIWQCSRPGHTVPVFVKQLGKNVWQDAFTQLDMEHDRGHGGDMQDWPEDTRFRDFPTCY